MIMKNVRELESKSEAVFTEFKFADNTIRQMLFVARKLICLHNEQEKEQWNDEIVAKYIGNQEIRCQNGEIGRRTFLMRKTTTDYLKQIYNTGTVNYKRHNKQRTALPDYFEKILLEILSDTERTAKSNKVQHDYASLFFRWLYFCGHNDLTSVGEQVVREYLTDCSSRMNIGSLDSTRRELKRLFLFLSGDGKLSEPKRSFQALHRVPAYCS